MTLVIVAMSLSNPPCLIDLRPRVERRRVGRLGEDDVGDLLGAGEAEEADQRQVLFQVLLQTQDRRRYGVFERVGHQVEQRLAVHTNRAVVLFQLVGHGVQRQAGDRLPRSQSGSSAAS